MGELVELFPEPPEGDESSELLHEYAGLMDWGHAPPLEQARAFLDLAKELTAIEDYAFALDSLRASWGMIAELDDRGFGDAFALIIKSHYRSVCVKVYGSSEDEWPTLERSFLTSAAPQAESKE